MKKPRSGKLRDFGLHGAPPAQGSVTSGMPVKGRMPNSG